MAPSYRKALQISYFQSLNVSAFLICFGFVSRVSSLVPLVLCVCVLGYSHASLYSYVAFFMRLGNLCFVCVWSECLCLIRLFVFAFDFRICVWPVWSERLCLMRGASPPLFQLSPPAVVGQWVSRSQLGNTWPSPFLVVCCVCLCVSICFNSFHL